MNLWERRGKGWSGVAEVYPECHQNWPSQLNSTDFTLISLIYYSHIKKTQILETMCFRMLLFWISGIIVIKNNLNLPDFSLFYSSHLPVIRNGGVRINEVLLYKGNHCQHKQKENAINAFSLLHVLYHLFFIIRNILVYKIYCFFWYNF